MTDEPEEETLNEWVVSELSRTMDSLRDLARRHEEVLNHLADVCRRNDKMEAAGQLLINAIYHVTCATEEEQDRFNHAIQKWGEANV